MHRVEGPKVTLVSVFLLVHSFYGLGHLVISGLIDQV